MDYESIVKQIRDKEFDKEISLRDEQYKIDKDKSIKLAEAELEKHLKEEINKQEIEIEKLKNELKVKDKENEIKLKDALKSL